MISREIWTHDIERNLPKWISWVHFRRPKEKNYLLLIVDQFSKWYEAVALHNQEEKTVAKAFVEHWIVRFGCPVNLHSDQGSIFMSKMFCSL